MIPGFFHQYSARYLRILDQRSFNAPPIEELAHLWLAKNSFKFQMRVSCEFSSGLAELQDFKGGQASGLGRALDKEAVVAGAQIKSLSGHP